MKQIEENIIKSFQLAKKDIIQLQSEVRHLLHTQEKLMEEIKELRNPVVKKVSKRAKKQFLASKTGKKFHVPECVFTKNIKPKMIVKHASKDAMLNKGYKPCTCTQ